MESFKYRIGTYKPKRMTLIIGMKCKNYVVLFGDRKITEDDLGGFHYENKITAPIENLPISVACAGLTDLAKEFNSKINFLVQQRNNQYYWKNVEALKGAGVSKEEVGEIANPPFIYTYEDFLDDCATLASEIAEPAKAYVQTPIEALVAASTPNGLKLYHVAHTGFRREGKFFAIGSGSQFIEKFLEESYDESMDFEQAMHVGSFLIKVVEDLGLDKAVGVGDEKLPQVFVIKQTEEKYGEVKFEEKLREAILQVTNDRIKLLKQAFTLFPK